MKKTSKIRRITLSKINELWASPEVKFGFDHVAFAHAIINEIRKQGIVVQVEDNTEQGEQDET